MSLKFFILSKAPGVFKESQEILRHFIDFIFGCYKLVKMSKKSLSSEQFKNWITDYFFFQAGITVHYENNSPFLIITRLERTLEISHWGNIAVEEDIDVYHHGAQLKGPFSRYEYQREANSGVASVKSFKVSK